MLVCFFLSTIAAAWTATAGAKMFHVAPMQTYTNLPLRRLFSFLAPELTLWTEMEKLADLKTDDDWSRRFGAPGSCFKESDVVLQLGGNRPAEFREVLSRVNTREYSFNEVNLNCGCPSVKKDADFGASLMRNPTLTKELLLSMGEALQATPTTKISLKCRLSAVETYDDLQGGGGYDYEQLCKYIHVCVSSGCLSRVVLHCRPAVMSGLSPVKNRQVPKLKYEFAGQLERDFPGLEVVLNGGVRSYDDLIALQDKNLIPSGGVMCGRWCLKEPVYACAAASSWVNGDDFSGSFDRDVVRSALVQYSRFLSSREANLFPRDQLFAPLYLLQQELQEMDEEKEDYIEWLSDCVDRIRTRMHRTSSTSFKSINLNVVGVSKKVVSKWKRNRAEL